MKLLVKLIAVLCCLSFLLLGVCAADTPEMKVYTYTDAAPEVPTVDIFRTIYNEAVDIRIEGERAAWMFFYENIFRTTGKWRPFSSAVGLIPAEDSACDPEIAALAGEGAYYLDLRDGDLYPGTAVVYVSVGDLLSADVPYTLYVYQAPGKEEG
ncbi:MAG: hypothetical protein J6S41_05290, partial [Clostridia bacterium]|nr:hypothetical protein [Clostridia bacterium]